MIKGADGQMWIGKYKSWKDFQGAVTTAAEQGLHGRPQANKVWIQKDTLELVDKERMAFMH